MKKAAILAAALAMVLSLAACGGRDDNNSDNQTNGSITDNNGVNGSSGSNDYNNNGSGSPGTGTGTGSMTGPGSPDSSGSGTTSGTGSGVNHDAGIDGRSRVGGDLRRAADSVGDAVTDLVDDGCNALARSTSATTFQRMLDNARVHDTDGVLTDGENSRW